MIDTDPAPKPKPIQRTPEQRYAAALAQAARAKDEMRRRDTREKVIVGALAIRRAMRSPAGALALITLIEDEVTSDGDLLALSNLLGRLHLAGHPLDPPSTEPGAGAGGERGEP